MFKGLSVGNEKPEVHTFLNPILIQLKDLEYGFDLSIDNILEKRKFFLIAGVFDKPAKALVLNIKSSNGFYGCHVCEQPGETFKGKKDFTGDQADGDQNSRRHIYKFKSSNPKGPLRTEENYQLALKTATFQHDVKGIKGISCLNGLKHYKVLGSTCIDYMHSLLEGVIKNFFSFWFDSECSTGAYSMRKYMQEIDNRLLTITPPKFVPRTPRSIYSYNIWHAHEYLSFMIYYSLAVFRDIMQPEYYNNLKKLVIFMEKILSATINIDDLKKAEAIVFDFVEEVQNIYPNSIMLSGLHEMLHLVDCTLKFGPLNSINCFQFEELNRKLIRFLHSYDLIGEELIKIFSTAQILSNYSFNISNARLNDYIKTKLCFKTSNRKRLNSKTEIKSIDVPIITKNQQYIKITETYTKKTIAELFTFEKISYNGVILNSQQFNASQTKRCDSAFINNNNELGLIESFVIHNNSVYIIAKRIVKMFNAFSSSVHPEIRSNLYACYITNQLFIEKPSCIRKIVLIRICDSNCFVSLFNSSHLFN